MTQHFSRGFALLFFGALTGYGVLALSAPSDRIREKGIIPYLSELNDAPVGSVLAFCGIIPETADDREAWEDACGWLVCDGRPLSRTKYQQLRDILRGGELPNMDGMFLRGINRESPLDDKWRDADGIRQVGSRQEFATARPKEPFKTGGTPDDPSDGQHSHAVKTVDRSSPNPKAMLNFDRLLASGDKHGGTWPGGKTDSLSIEKAEEPFLLDTQKAGPGAHEHIIGRGGDKETRPVNIAVYWIIKFKTMGDRSK